MGQFNLKRVVLDVVKPSEVSSLTSLAEEIGEVPGVKSLNITVEEVDSKTEGLLVTVEGDQIDFKKLSEVIARTGAVVHSIDQVAGGEKIIEGVPVPLSKVRR